MRHLLEIKGFIPYVLMLFLNAFVDLGHKITLQNTIFKMHNGQEQIILTAMVNALMLLPYILLFTPAGFLSDKYPKHFIMRYSAFAKVLVVICIIAAYYFGLFWCAFLLTLVLAMQSAIYSPAKYGYIRELVGNTLLAQANGVVQAVTIVSILLSTLVFSALFEWLLKGVQMTDTSLVLQSIYPLGFVLLVLVLVEWGIAFLLPARREVDRQQHFHWNQYIRAGYLKKNIQTIQNKPVIGLSILGLITFWSTSQVVLAVFPAFAKEVLGQTNTLVIQGILACTGIGITAGSLFAGRASRQHLELGFLPLGAVGFALCLGIMPNLNSALMMALLFIISGFLGGLFIVPLNALMQYHASPQESGTVLAANNWLQNIVMCLFLGLTIALSAIGINSAGLFYCLMLAALIPALFTLYHLPQSLVRFLLVIIFKGTCTVRIEGFQHLPAQGQALLCVQNRHWIDAVILQLVCPRKMGFVMLAKQPAAFWQKQLYAWFDMHPVEDIQQGVALVKPYLQADELVCILQDSNDFTQWLGAIDVETVLLPVYIAAQAASTATSILPAYGDVVVDIGRPLSLAVNALQLQLVLAGQQIIYQNSDSVKL